MVTKICISLTTPVYPWVSIIWSTVSAQKSLTNDKWEEIEQQDEFVDKNGKINQVFFSFGKYSDRYNYDEDLRVRVVIFDKKKINIRFSDWNTFNEIETPFKEFGNFKIKRQNGSKESYQVYSSSQGRLIKDNYDALFNLINNGKSEKIQVSIEGASFNGYSKQKFKFYLITTPPSMPQNN